MHDIEIGTFLQLALSIFHKVVTTERRLHEGMPLLVMAARGETKANRVAVVSDELIFKHVCMSLRNSIGQIRLCLPQNRKVGLESSILLALV